MNFDTLLSEWAAFVHQPFGAVGAICIMVAVTAYNSTRLRDALRTRLDSDDAMSLLLNALNLIGGTFLFINAYLRDEVIWKFLEIYFVIVAIKGVWQARHALAAGQRTGDNQPS